LDFIEQFQHLRRTETSSAETASSATSTSGSVPAALR